MSASHVHVAICEVKAILAKHGGITKERQAPMGYSFRGIEDMDNVLCGITAQVGLVVYPRILSKEIRHTQTAKGAYQSHVIIEVEWTYASAKDGSTFVTSTIGEAMDTQDKAFNKAMQAARKYADIMVFRIPTSGDDTEAYAETPAPEPKVVARYSAPTPPPPPPSEPKKRGRPKKTTAPTVSEQAEAVLATAAADTDENVTARVMECKTFGLLFAFAQEADRIRNADMMASVAARAVQLWADAKTIDEVKAGYPLLEALKNEGLKRAANEAYARVRNA
jgi:hypothetical protein